jgi:predicted nucleic acid-binding Zn ribbon protein
MTVIILEPGDDEDEMVGSGWIDQDSPEIRERRRNVLLRELQRVQRASFIHFMVLCLIPTSLLFIVIATVVGEDDDCESTATTCEKEPRTFIST